jgi:putative membrane protein
MSDLNDPRVFFAAERTLLAWNRTSLALMAFGFVIERFGLFVRLLTFPAGEPIERGVSFWIGLAFIVLGALTSGAAIAQYLRVLRTLRPPEIPEGYRIHFGTLTNAAVAGLGGILAIYLFAHGASL